MLVSWHEFLRGKRRRKDVAVFCIHLMDNIIGLHLELKNKAYKHGSYFAFKINDPKPRDIHKASVRDRLLHHAITRILTPYFEKQFIYDSYSCRSKKGTHRAVNRFRDFSRKASHNNTKTAWVLKGDIRKFFASIDHIILKNILEKHITNADVMWLLGEIIDSFYTKDKISVGLPLGNLTSQLLVNIYMNEFDQFIKRDLKIRYYIRYADDFVILSENKQYLVNLISKISEFLEIKLKLSLNPNKLFIKTSDSGVDFLGWVNFPNHRVLRTATKRRMLKNLKNNYENETITSYLGLLKHGNNYKLLFSILTKIPINVLS